MPARSRLLATATAVPPTEMHQADVKALCARLYADRPDFFARMEPVYDNAGVEKRHSCVSLDWYGEPHGWRERMALFEEHSLALAAAAAERALAEAGVAPQEVASVVGVCTTGIATPSLEARLIERIGLSPAVCRLPVFGLGCAGGVLGLTRADAMARAAPGAPVLMVAVELCALTFRPQEHSKANIVASALFGDGAAAVVLRADEAADPAEGEPAGTLGPAGEHTWPDSHDVMGWRVEEDGLGVIFSQSIPVRIRRDLPEVVDTFLRRHGLARGDIDGWLLHPGGTKVLGAYETALALAPDALELSRAVLAAYGNMSSVSVLAVLDRARRAGCRGRHLMAALGPGFSAGMQLVTL